MLVLISVTKNIRTNPYRSISDYFDSFLSANDVFLELVSEFGGSINPLLYTITLVPELYPFRYGYTYFMALLSIIPNLGFWSVHPAEKYAALSNWVTRAANHTWSGLGYSSTAEAYINFSWLGCLVFLAWGYIITKVIFDCKDSNKNTVLKTFIIIAMFLCLFYSFVRGDFRDMVRSFTWRILPILLMYYLLLQRNKFSQGVTNEYKKYF